MLVMIASSAVRFVSNLIVVYILSPEDFAISGLLVSIIFVLMMISDSGFRPFLIRYREEANQDLVNTVWTLRLVRGVALFLLLFASSQKIAEFVDIPELELVLKVSAVVFFLDGFQSLAHVIHERGNKVARPLYVEFFSLLISRLVTISFALLLESYWAFVIGIFVEYLIKLVASYVAYGPVSRGLHFDAKYATALWAITKVIIPSSLLTVLIMQSDKYVLVNYLSVAQLGAYFLAISIVRIPETFVLKYSRRVLVPLMAFEKRNSEQLENAKSKIYGKKTNIFVLFSFLIGLSMVIAPYFVGLIYPSEYSETGTFITIILVNSILLTISIPQENWLLILERDSIVLINNILRCLWIFVFVITFYNIWGALGVILAYATKETLPSVYSSFVAWKLGIFKLREECLSPLAGGLGYLAALVILKSYILPM